MSELQRRLGQQFLDFSFDERANPSRRK